MITDEKREWLEQLYVQFTQALFGMGNVPRMYMVVINGKAEVIPQKPEQMPEEALPTVVSAYANAVNAELVLHISEGWALSVEKNSIVELPIKEHPNRIEILTMMIGEPAGQLHLISGEIKRAIDNTPYIPKWAWLSNVDTPTGLILPFDD